MTDLDVTVGSGPITATVARSTAVAASVPSGGVAISGGGSGSGLSPQGAWTFDGNADGGLTFDGNLDEGRVLDGNAEG